LQLDIKNVFLHSDLEEEVYMEQPLEQSLDPWFGKFNHIVQTFGLKYKQAYNSIFYYQISFEKYVYLIVYVDYIVIIGNNAARISQLMEQLPNHFQTKNLESLKYFLGIEVV